MITEYRLNMIKRSIVNEKELFNNDFEIKELTKNVCENINCYAYSLGIMEPAPSGTNLYIPGFTTFEKVDYLSKENFILKVSEDLHNLKIEFREYGIDLSQKIQKILEKVFFTFQEKIKMVNGFQRWDGFISLVLKKLKFLLW